MTNPSKKTSILISGCLLGTVVLATVMPAQALNVNVKAVITVDNSYALYYGTSTAATNWVGNDFHWPSVEVYTIPNLPPIYYLYVVTASDIGGAQGFLGQFENLDTVYKFYSNDPQWQVMATGLRTDAPPTYGAPYTDSTADFALLTKEILDANAGLNPSGVTNISSWVGTTAGPNNGSAPWGTLSSIAAAARWAWYSSNGDPDPTAPAYNHDEWLVFRIPIGATPESVPGPLPVLGAASAWAWSRRLRNRIRSQSTW
jgi:hypothetical protein